MISESDYSEWGQVEENEVNEVLDKIRAEIDQIKPYDLPSCDRTAEKMISRVLDIIDKYRGEQP